MQLLNTLARPATAGTQVSPQLLLSQGAIDMIATYVNAQPSTEINGFAYVKQLNPGILYVEAAIDVFITPQTVTMGSAEVEGTAYALALDRAVQDDRMAEFRLQWHSHPGEAYFSPTDMANIENFGATGGEWFISLVTNRHGDLRARLDMFRPVRVGTEIEVCIYRNPDPAMLERAEADIATMVTVVAPKKSSRLGGLVRVTTSH
jgi:hypothetical protein